MINKIKQSMQRKVYEHILKISPRDAVLDIGSGNSPNPRSDVLCDKYTDYNEERGDRPLRTNGRAFYQADVCKKLPFKDKEFDYVIASQVLEHVENPKNALEEIMRVGKRGYIECPSLFGELLRPTRKHHRWVILNINNKLVFYDKSLVSKPVFGTIFEKGSLLDNIFLRMFHIQYSGIFLVKFFWNEKIDYIINPKDKYYKKFFEEPYDMNKLDEVTNGKPKTVYYVIFESLARYMYRLIK
ncbi:MAG: class I SAM-dependent methyltransferase [Candidatus Diapherotrites archaeon]|nr:class I SAM-dependent methyltransferase [Candidatus Diapherotrites archaeon]